MLEFYKCSSSTSLHWNPSPIVALATSVDESQVAAAREDGSLEIWLVSPGAVGCHCQLTIQGDPNLRVSSLVWCGSGCGGVPAAGRLFSSSIDGSISEWDLFNLTQKVVMDPIGVSIWQMATNSLCNRGVNTKDLASIENGHPTDKCLGDGDLTNDSEVEADSSELYEEPITDNASIAIACDDGSVRLYNVSVLDQFNHYKTLPRVSGEKVSEKVSLASDFMYNYMSRDVTASFGYDYILRQVKNHLISREGCGKDVRHFEFQALSSVKYRNKEEYIEDGVSFPNVPIKLKRFVELTMDVTSVSPRHYFFEVMSFFASAEHEKERLQYFASSEGRDDLYQYNQKECGTVFEGFFG